MDYTAFDPLNDGPTCFLKPDGNLRKGAKSPLDDELVIMAYKDMLFAREADLMSVSFQRQGRMFTYPPNRGQEAVSVAAGLVMQEEDWLVPAFRELAAWLAKGVSLKEIFLFWRGHEDSFRFENAPRVFPIAVPIASQIPHAAGLGFAVKKKGGSERVFAFIGDGGTSEGDFHEGLNFAAVWEAPMVCIVQNNQFAISVPMSKQTRSKTLAAKAVSYGIPGVQVDGNDLFAMVDVLRWARDYVAEHGPVLIEAVTYRMGAHTTSDDPTKYRTKDEEAEWADKDPLLRLERYLSKQDLLDQGSKEEWIEGFRKEITRQFEAAENYGEYPLGDVFDHLYSEPPEDLGRQRMEHEAFLEWLRSRQSSAEAVR